MRVSFRSGRRPAAKIRRSGSAGAAQGAAPRAGLGAGAGGVTVLAITGPIPTVPMTATRLPPTKIRRTRFIGRMMAGASIGRHGKGSLPCVASCGGGVSPESRAPTHPVLAADGSAKPASRRCSAARSAATPATPAAMRCSDNDFDEIWAESAFVNEIDRACRAHLESTLLVSQAGHPDDRNGGLPPQDLTGGLDAVHHR